MVKIGRVSGLLLHVTSLPSRFGIGDLGPQSRWFADSLAESGQKLWCILPLGPTGPENSPYQARSAFAGNPLLISPEELLLEGYLVKQDLAGTYQFAKDHVEFAKVRRRKEALLRKAFHSFAETGDYLRFARANAWWLDSYAQFMSLREANGGVPWTRFDKRIQPTDRSIRFHKFVQYEFFRQWASLRKYCRARQISILGDMPFYVEHDSADVWSNPTLFDLRKNGESRTVGGVPPDYFSKDGQRWGTPTYRWDQLKKTGFTWWVNRLRAALQTADFLRLDHFRGFAGYWSVPAAQPTARYGRWLPGPGSAFFETIRKKLGTLPFIAENLGTITPEVEDLRNKFGLPGMAVLQFAFDDNGVHRPNNYVREMACFTGTHDNDTTVGWWQDLNRSARRPGNSAEREKVTTAKAYLQITGNNVQWPSMQAILTSVADLAVIPMQDVVGLDSQARMNRPGHRMGNWGWRLEKRQFSKVLRKRLHGLTKASGR